MIENSVSNAVALETPSGALSVGQPSAAHMSAVRTSAVQASAVPASAVPASTMQVPTVQTFPVHGAAKHQRENLVSMSAGLGQELTDLLKSVVNTPLKVQVIQLFQSNSGVCLSSSQMATRLQAEQDDVRVALQQLNDDGALTYCPYFGNADLCLMNPNYHTTAMKRDLAALRFALEVRPDAVWEAVRYPDGPGS